MRIGVGMCVHNEEDYVAWSLRAIYDFADVIAVSVNVGKPWGGTAEPLDRTLEILRSYPDPEGKIRIQPGEWDSEVGQRNANLDLIRKEIDYYMVVDADEMYSLRDLDRLRRYVKWRPYAGQFRIRLCTYWKTNPIWRIDPPEPLKAYILTRVRPKTKFVGLRRTNERWVCVVPRRVAVCHHFSYARTTARIEQKLRNFSHQHEVIPNWFENVWLGWDRDHALENLHPTNPPEYRRAVPVEESAIPEAMRAHPYWKSIDA